MLRGAGAIAEGAGDETPMERSSYQHVFPRKQQTKKHREGWKKPSERDRQAERKRAERVSSEPSRVDAFLSRHVFDASL
ncbi:uncharacterized protein ARB_01381 [Trichophyton benhamiae CBS 112371]|uniref:Uncharacterized protein n=1 Tax=Arthroderma benhamiae (strain ATCC MYA-4681 / CBS 112371) TaxID=663331 RepID=D4AYW2_ARTBC|nr:uncharacterized protein ARB_01381 [Trichophyton benhamiae CBS 112371]EFE31782.1 hypothetical protein ARB_01381 [Trichophyton benhamiae CBS 112371]